MTNDFKRDNRAQAQALILNYFPNVDLKKLTIEDYEDWLLKAQWLEQRYWEHQSKIVTQPILKTIVDVAKKMTKGKK